jgi:cyclophilin family peptidyl-prolyl cis-trans isomerase
MAAQSQPSHQAVIETSKGRIVIELYPDKAPGTVANFLAYADDGFYNGTIFHRVIPGFMIQGGGMTPGLVPKATRPPIRNEAAKGLSNQRGTVAMARTNDPHSATSQFFINVVDNAKLDYPAFGGGYCAFGRVLEGMSVVDAIAAAPTTTERDERGRAFQNVPVEDIVIRSITRR